MLKKIISVNNLLFQKDKNMKLRQYCLVGIATSLIVATTDQVGLAFSFTLPSRSSLPCDPFSSFYCNKHTLTLPGADGGTVTTKLKKVSSLTLGGTDAFFNLLTKSVWAKNGWQFQRATTDLAGIFNIGVYNAYATLQTVGADIQILYNPVGQDPTGSNVHWIQRVISNHGYIFTRSGRTDLGHGIRENKIDVLQEQTQLNFVDPQNPQKLTFNPFYDTYGTANEISFGDFLGREDIGENHEWSAELYLVQETAPKTVTIYNGIKWGWSNTFTPPPPPPPPPPCNGSSGGGGCRTALASNIQVQNQALSDIEISKSSPTPVSVPEPIPALGLLALGIWGTFQGLKIIKDKQ
ncbi:MAG TPA: hypothetical protein DCY91_18270 [Cyanobacteria bacterium UBA11370]|nr:hypothetical protein [Cyanobacteria bacterium UBA11370]